MNNSVYKINKGINKPIEFKGLKAQYIGYLGIGILVLLILFAVLFIAGVNRYVCIILIAILGTGLFMGTYKLSDTYGQHGLTKRLARRNMPSGIVANSRLFFIQLKR